MHQGRVAKHWGYWIDLHHRTKNNFTSNLHAELVRFGGTYFINDNFRISVGYAFIAHFPSVTKQRFVRPEHRPWQQVFYTHTHKNFRTLHYIRSEQRFLHKTAGETLADGYHFRERLRFSSMVVFVLNKKQFKQGSWGISLSNEVFINAYSTDKAKTFDQNRAVAAITYNITDQLQLQLGYMNIFAITPKGNEITHAIRLFAFHTIDWRKKK